jgi:hypothetical protein
MSDAAPDWLRWLQLVAFIGLFVWMVVDMCLFSRMSGKLDRGVTVRREVITAETYQFLRSLSANVVDKGCFIRVEPQGALVSAWPWGYRSSWPCLAFVDFSKGRHELQYRLSLPGLLPFVPFLPYSIVALPFFWGLLVFNHHVFRRAIRDFIDRELARSKSEVRHA